MQLIWQLYILRLELASEGLVPANGNVCICTGYYPHYPQHPLSVLKAVPYVFFINCIVKRGFSPQELSA